MLKLIFSFLIFICSFPEIRVFSQQSPSFVNLSEINSSSDDYLPFLIDSTLFFTSTRKNTREGQTLEFSEKVYYSVKNNGQWSLPQKMGYKWNSDNNTALVGTGPGILYFYRSYWRNNGEIFTAKLSSIDSAGWQALKLKKLFKICSDYDENCATSANGDTTFFVSDRNGNYDIFMQVRDSIPVPMDSLNSDYDEEDIYLSPDSRSIYFSSNRPGGKGGFDIYNTCKINNYFTRPVPVEIKGVNTESDDRDFRWYNDSTMLLSSNREGGQGGFDIYMLYSSKSGKKPPGADSLKAKDSTRNIIKKDTLLQTKEVKNTGFVTIEHVDTILQQRNELIEQLKILGLIPFRGEVQLGAYRLIQSLELYKQKFPCIINENIRVDKQKVDTIIINKYIINILYTDIDSALDMQLKLVNYRCLPDQNFSDIPFIAMIDQNRNRFAIFWKRDEYLNKKIFFIFENGKQIWKSRRF